MRKKLRIFLVIIVTVLCIYCGIKVREKNGIVVTQLETTAPGSLSYILETNKNNIIMIDGGGEEDASHLEEVLQNKGGIVEQWFITIAHPENFGAMKRILENGKIQVNHINISFNVADWYENNEPEKYGKVAEFLDFIYSEKMISKVDNVPLKHEILVDNLYIKVLNAANTELKSDNIGYDQSVVLKVNNTYKSMTFMGNIANDGAYKFKDNNLDEIDCDAVQISNNNVQNVNDEIYEMMSPKYIFMPTSKENETSSRSYFEHLKELLKPKESYLAIGGDVTYKIW